MYILDLKGAVNLLCLWCVTKLSDKDMSSKRNVAVLTDDDSRRRGGVILLILRLVCILSSTS
jgi:hypothetical protein